MLTPLHMYMYLKLIDIQILFWSYMYSLLNLCLWQKFKPNFYGIQILTLFFTVCTLSWHNLQHPLHITVHSHVLLHEDVVRKKLRVVWLRNKKNIDQ